jgi:hypothetical protein
MVLVVLGGSNAVLGGCNLGGCNNDRAGSDPERSAAPPRLAGVYADKWSCESVATIDALRDLLGGAVTRTESAMPVPPGVPRPCTYQVQARDLESWTFDLDCRDSMKQKADALFAQYRQSSRENVEHHARSDAGSKPRDGSAETFTPAEAVDVSVGANGLDHHGRGLIFIDDDAPCYVRIIGKDAVRRLELARLLAKNLTFANAPMTPRAFP